MSPMPAAWQTEVHPGEEVDLIDPTWSLKPYDEEGSGYATGLPRPIFLRPGAEVVRRLNSRKTVKGVLVALALCFQSKGVASSWEFRCSAVCLQL